MREQIAQQPPAIRRASLPAQYHTAPPPASRHRAGHHPGLHPEDQPYTTFTRTRYTAPTLGEDEEDDEPLSSQRTRSSAIVYRQPYTQVAPVIHTKELEEQPRKPKHPLFYIGVSMLLALVFIVAYIYLPPAYQKWSDDRTYGYPRTFQTDANVGHGGTEHFIALNTHGTIEVLEIPSDPSKTNQPRLYIIMHLSGQGADLVPATVSFPDINVDGKPDMQVTVYDGTNPSIWILFNNGTTFVPKL